MDVLGQRDGLDRSVARSGAILNVRLHGSLHDNFLVRALESDQATLIKAMSHTALLAKLPVDVFERLTDLRPAAIRVVGHAPHHDRGSARTIPAKANLADRFLLGDELLDAFVDRRPGNVVLQGQSDTSFQTRVVGLVGTTRAHGQNDVAEMFGRDLAFFLLGRALFVLDVGLVIPAPDHHAAVAAASGRGAAPAGRRQTEAERN
mmetsp:Transcript_110954/g.312816  ORF Transcript_110954/g.312816 Transcript_110954/m.312816 type:complete len:205 (+) Transcript_110954:342-956(+)